MLPVVGWDNLIVQSSFFAIGFRNRIVELHQLIQSFHHNMLGDNIEVPFTELNDMMRSRRRPIQKENKFTFVCQQIVEQVPP